MCIYISVFRDRLPQREVAATEGGPEGTVGIQEGTGTGTILSGPVLEALQKEIRCVFVMRCDVMIIIHV